jgi:hypothetical protein
MIATIAQIHLHPNVRDKLCTILPAQAKCHLAPVAAWADQVKGHYPGSAPMHYVNRTCRSMPASEGEGLGGPSGGLGQEWGEAVKL